MLKTIYALSALLLLEVAYIWAVMAQVVSAPRILSQIDTFWLLVITTSILGFLVPMLISFHRNRTYLLLGQKRILYRVPFSAIIIALFIGIAVSAVIYTIPSGGGGPGSDFVAMAWLLLAVPIYIASQLVLSFLVSLFALLWIKFIKQPATSAQDLPTNDTISAWQKIIWLIIGLFILAYFIYSLNAVGLLNPARLFSIIFGLF